jgi:voltage-gated potassium channel Kch
VTERIYRTIQLIGFESGTMDSVPNWALEISRFLLPGLTAYTALQALSILFKEQTQWLQLWRVKDHCIVCGLGRKGSYFVRDLLENGQKLVVIDKNINPLTAQEYRQRGAVVLVGDATDKETLLSARITRAKTLVSLLGHDQDNLRIAHLAYQLSKQNQNELTCSIHLASQDLLGLIKRSELTLASDPFYFETFNTYRRAADQIIQSEYGWDPTESSQPRHILIIGMGRLGENLALQTGYQWFTSGSGKKLTVTVLDRNAIEKTHSLCQRQPELEETIHFQPLDLDLSAPKSVESAFNKIKGLESITQAFLCISDSILNLQILLALRESRPFSQIPIFVRVEKTSDLADLFTAPIIGLAGSAELHLFDIHEETCSVDLVMGGSHDLLARQLRARYLQSQKSPQAAAQLAIPWVQVPEDEKLANREQANRITRLLGSKNYRLSPLQHWNARDLAFSNEELLEMAEMEHNLWCEWKRANGWQYGPERSDQMKTNPDLLSWEELPTSEKNKTMEVVQAFPQMLADMGFEIIQHPQPPK